MNSSRRVSLIVLFLLAAVPAFGVDLSNLSPQVQSRRYLAELVEANKNEDNAKIAEVCEKMLALPGVVIDPAIRFHYAKSLFALGKVGGADRELTTFLKAKKPAPELVDEALALAEEIEKELGKPGWMCLEGNSLRDGSIEFGHDGSGVFVSNVIPADTTGKDGIKIGDLLISYNRVPIKDGAQLNELIAKTKPGSQVPVIAIRGMDKKRVNLTVEIETEPANAGELMSEYARKNIDEYFNWLSEANDNGFTFTYYRIGWCYESGSGVTKDDAEALKWYRKAVDTQGEEAYHSMRRLAYIYGGGGDGSEKNIAEAIKWHKATIDSVKGMSKATDAAKRGARSSMSALGEIYLDSDGKNKNIKNIGEAIKWYTMAANEGDKFSMATLGRMYRDGAVVSKDIAKSIKWFESAARKGNEYAAMDLAYLYRHGNGVNKDIAKAVKWYKEALEVTTQDDVVKGSIYNQLGDLYYESKNYDAAREWYTKSKEAGNPLGEMMLNSIERRLK